MSNPRHEELNPKRNPATGAPDPKFQKIWVGIYIGEKPDPLKNELGGCKSRWGLQSVWLRGSWLR